MTPAEPPLRPDDVVRLLHEVCREAGSQKSWAEAHDLSPAYVSDVIAGRRDPGASVLAALGLERVPMTYRRVTA
ncbi:helix-turn-helix transcriptional regulator [Antarcticirhabdus aurantiaca]|uniref:helix-turn-helix transcriptional regulator n=1 Tax=Antarcticirhabdus aurantiaca TaxID=2606717 RepID=UPI00131ACF26|nr:helix-turn-helix transcriptional regulator [Antarcticirhabdus aurantiaca]